MKRYFARISFIVGVLLSLSCPGCLDKEVVSPSGLTDALAARGLPLSLLQEATISAAFYSGDHVDFERRYESQLEMSFLQFVSLSGQGTVELGKILQKLDTVKNRDGSVCACAFGMDFVIRIETANHKVFHLVVDPEHHRIYLFVDSKLNWMDRITEGSWSTLRKFIEDNRSE